MSFFNKLQKILGFSYEDEQADLQDTTSSQFRQPAVAMAAVNGREADGPEPRDNRAPASQLPQGNGSELDVSLIFKGVVEVLNKELPPYLSANLDTEGQRRFLLEKLDESVRDYLRDIAESERLKVQKSREKERDKLKRAHDELKEKLRVAEEHLARESEKALSAERQKRALTTRANDLERRIAALEADKEQYELENRSLLNKLRVVEVTGAMGADREELAGNYNSLKDEHERLQQEYAEASAKIEGLDGDLKQARGENERLAGELRDANRLNRKLEEQAATTAAELSTAKEQLGESLRWKSLYEESQMKIDRLVNSVPAPREERPQAPVYELISFDDETFTQPSGAVNDELNADSQITAPAPRPKESHGKKQRKRKKTAGEEKDDFLDTTDWLVDAEQVENVDRVVPADSAEAPTDSEKGSFPSQMSLF